MKSKLFFSVLAIAMVALFSSCDKIPQDKIDAAKVAIDSAKLVEADIYVAAEYAAVQDSMKAVQAEVEVVNSKFFKNFDACRERLDRVMAQAKTVAANAVTKKAEVKAEVETLMTDVNNLLADNKKLMGKAPRGKEGAAVLAQIKTEMAAIETSVADAKAMYDTGKYMDASNKLKAAKDSATGINTELNDAIAKAKGKKK